MNPARPRVLIAGTPEALETLGALLGDEVDIVAALSVREAVGLLDSGVHLVICSVRFDESRMFDFLHEVQRKSERGSRLPVVCCRTHGNPFPSAARRAIELALEALGVGSFVDLAQLRAEHGEAAYVMFRAMVLAHLQRPPS
jgi:response regulator RpfG family c-di-GMP phosphodiesterase